MIAAALIPFGALVLVVSAPAVAGAIVFAMIFGMGNGLLSIVTGTLPLALFGSDGYGKLQGKMMAARLILSALAPFALAISMENIGIAPSIGAVVFLGSAALLFFLAIGWVTRPTAPSSTA